MSYSVDLWNSYNKVESQLESNIRGLKTFIYILSEYHSSQTALANELKRLSEYGINNQITTHKSLSEGISSFQTDLLNQYDYLTEFLNNMKIEILDPLKLLKERLVKTLNNNLNEMNSTEKNYNNCISQLESAKKRFHISIKEVEQLKLKSEILKKKYNSNMNNEEIKREEIKALNSLKSAKENENTYITLINESNKLQEEYVEIKKKNLNQIEFMEEEIGNNIKDCLRKYIIFQVSYIRNFQYDIDKKAKIMESINIYKDISNYIFQNATNAIPPFKYDYVPYISDLNNFHNNKNNSVDKDVIKDVNNFIENIFTCDKAKEIILLKNKINLEIESISEEIFTSKNEIKDFDKNNWEKINKYIKNKSNRRELLRNLNNLRRKKGLNISDITYDNIGKILNICLDELSNNKQKEIDYDSIIIIINLSSTLYKTSNDTNNSLPRIFLQKSINEHQIWKKYEIWKGIIKHSINEEMHNQKNFNIYSKEDFTTKKERINNIVKFQLNTYLYNMLSFDVKKNFITQIIEEFKNYYDLPENIIDSLNKIIEDNENKEKNEKKIIVKKNDLQKEKDKEKEKDEEKEKEKEKEKKEEKEEEKEKEINKSEKTSIETKKEIDDDNKINEVALNNNEILDINNTG